MQKNNLPAIGTCTILSISILLQTRCRSCPLPGLILYLNYIKSFSMEDTSATTATAIYASNCEVLHVDGKSYSLLKPRRSENRIMTSFINSLEDEVKPSGFGLKYTTAGKEEYRFGQKRFPLTAGKYLLVNESVSALEVNIPQTPTWSVCVDIEQRLFDEALQHLVAPDDIEDYHNLSQYLLSPELIVREQQAPPALQRFLDHLIASSARRNLERPSIELIYELTSMLAQESLPLAGAYANLRTARMSTRKELFRRLLLGKEILDESVFSVLNIKQVADTCCLSEFRFYKLFKQCFGDTPYNYLLKRKIEKSIALRRAGNSWNAIACELNFSDLAAFSNTFKKFTGIPPSKMLL